MSLGVFLIVLSILVFPKIKILVLGLGDTFTEIMVFGFSNNKIVIALIQIYGAFKLRGITIKTTQQIAERIPTTLRQLRCSVLQYNACAHNFGKWDRQALGEEAAT